MSTDALVGVAVTALGRCLPVKVQWQEVLDFISPSLLDFTQSVERVAAAERAFYEGRRKRNKSNAKKAAVATQLKELAQSFFEEIAKDKGH
jgi:predicted RNA-binding Zn ribbon-like protein